MSGMLRQLLHLLDTHAVGVSRAGAALLLAIGVGYSLMLGDTLRYVDGPDYLDIASNIIERGEFARGMPPEPTAFRPPAYPMMLGALVAIGTPVEGLRIANFVLLALSSLLLSSIALAARERIAAALVPFVLLGYPVLTYTAGTLFPQTLAGFLLCLLVYALYVPPRTTGVAVAAGLTFGVLILTAPIYLLLLPAVLLWSMAVREPTLKHSVVVCLVACLVTSPWLARNYVVFDEFPLFATTSGHNLLLGNSENTGPNSGTHTDITKYTDRLKELGLEEQELARDQFQMDRAVEYIAEHPGRIAVLYVRKFVNWFNVDLNLAAASQENKLRALVLALSYGVLIALVLVRAAFWRKHPVSAAEGLTIFLYFAAGAAYAVFFTRVRFRVPSDLLLALPAAAGASVLLTELTGRLGARSERSVIDSAH